jgi:hypothetical protein
MEYADATFPFVFWRIDKSKPELEVAGSLL